MAGFLQMNWTDVPGWFSTEDAECYKAIVDNTPINGMIVEIGCYLGRSTCCLISIIQAAGKNIGVHVIDTFKGSEEHQYRPELPTLEKQFRENIKSTGYPWVYIYPYSSIGASSLFPAKCLDAVFIDGAHDTSSVMADGQTWMQKVRKGGIIAGHDYDYPSVSKAVKTMFGENNIEQIGRCWLVRL